MDVTQTQREAAHVAARSPRDDPRYVSSDDPSAVLIAWGDEVLDLGGWTDRDWEAFMAAIRADVMRYDDEPLSSLVILERAPSQPNASPNEECRGGRPGEAHQREEEEVLQGERAESGGPPA